MKIENKQTPLESGYNSKTIAQEIMAGIDLNGKNVIITGGYAGIGLETTRVLTQAGARVFIPARDVEKAKANLNDLPNVELFSMDLSDLESIAKFAQEFQLKESRVDILINNAGIQLSTFELDKKGVEAHFSTNHLGHFYLTLKLWDSLKAAKGARVVNLSSYAHRLSEFHFDDPNYQVREYNAVEAYAQSKTANNLFTVALDKLGQPFNIRSFAAHPGSVGGTDLSRHFSYELGLQMGFIDEQGNINPEVTALLKTIPEGAATSVWCAVSSELDEMGGLYCENSDISALDANNLPDDFKKISAGVKPYSIDEDSAVKLWKLSETLVGEKFQS